LNKARKKKRENIVCRVLLIGVLVFLQIANLGYGKVLANEITSTESSTGSIEKSEENSSMVQSKEAQTERDKNSPLLQRRKRKGYCKRKKFGKQNLRIKRSEEGRDDR
jgi:hypothetical protein